MNKKILVITSIIFILLGSFSVCFANTELKSLTKEFIVDYKVADEFYDSINKTIVEDKVCYELKNVDRTDNFKTLTKKQKSVEERTTNTNNLDKVIGLFNETKDFEDEGYTGTLVRDNSTLKIQIKDSYQEEYKVYLQKSYDNVLSNELNDIPKEIKQDGITYYLVNPVWNVAETEMVSNNEVPVKYNGTMYYEGVKTKTIIKSYLATIKYSGIIEKQVPDTTTFTAKYEEVKEYGYIIPTIFGTTGLLFCSGIILFGLKNVKIYNLQNGEYKLIKRLHLNTDKLFIDLTPTSFQTRTYRILLSKSLYRRIKGKNIKFKYFDKNNLYEVTNKEFDIMV